MHTEYMQYKFITYRIMVYNIFDFRFLRNEVNILMYAYTQFPYFEDLRMIYK